MPSILVAFECSGRVRNAFAQKGWDAWSCDLKPSEDNSDHHIQGDAIEAIKLRHWDMIGAHPPCTYITCAANACIKREGVSRLFKMRTACKLFLTVWDLIDCGYLENPVGYMNKSMPKPQIIHPFYFGDRDMKRTCLWLKKLPPLIHIPEDDLLNKKTHSEKPEPISINPKNGKKRYFTDGGNDTTRRSRTFPSIAQAMADQWSQLKFPRPI